MRLPGGFIGVCLVKVVVLSNYKEIQPDLSVSASGKNVSGGLVRFRNCRPCGSDGQSSEYVHS